MPEPLTIEQFDKSLAATETRLTTYIDNRFTKFEAHFDETMDSVKETLNTIEDRIGVVEHLAVNVKELEVRMDRVEARMAEKFRKIGEHLAIPELTV